MDGSFASHFIIIRGIIISAAVIEMAFQRGVRVNPRMLWPAICSIGRADLRAGQRPPADINGDSPQDARRSLVEPQPEVSLAAGKAFVRQQRWQMILISPSLPQAHALTRPSALLMMPMRESRKISRWRFLVASWKLVSACRVLTCPHVCCNFYHQFPVRGLRLARLVRLSLQQQIEWNCARVGSTA